MMEAKKIEPTLLYKSPGAQRGPARPSGVTSYDFKPVKTQQELDTYLQLGWSLSLEEAIDKHLAPPAPPAPPAEGGKKRVL